MNESVSLQKQLGEYCKTGENAPNSSRPDAVTHYRRLVFNIGHNHLRKAFPLTLQLVGKDRFQQLVEIFYTEHKHESPQVWQLPKEFSSFYQEREFPFSTPIPFLRELLKYEWLEILVYMMEDVAPHPFTKKGDAMKDKHVANPELRVLSLQYPIHQKKLNSITEDDKGQYFVSFHRQYTSKLVSTNAITYPHLLILEDLLEQPKSAQELSIHFEQFLPKPEAIEATNQFVAFGLKCGLLLGFSQH